MALFAAGAIGGGDAKVYAGAAAFFPLSAGLQMLLWVTLTGGVLVLAWLVIRRLMSADKSDKDSIYAKFPYGVAIAVGAMGLAWNGASFA
jgi:prepilin peptidase CpaA